MSGERRPVGYWIGYGLGVLLTVGVVLLLLAGIGWLLGVRW